MSDETLDRSEELLPFDPSAIADDARLIFIGRIRSPWKNSGECPKNLRKARELGRPASVEVDGAYRAALGGIEGCSHVVLLYWLDRARRDLVIQRKRGAGHMLKTFATRAPVRPNPIGMAVVRLVSFNAETGILVIDAIDCIDATPLLDIKPYIPAVDAFPDATVAWLDSPEVRR